MSARGIHTLTDLNRPSGHDSDDDSDAPQEYYTGGEKSGMLVQDPKKEKDVDSIFDQARQFGTLQGQLENLQPSSSSTSFIGTGRVLSGETLPTAHQQQEAESIVHDIVFWRNGFSVDDGPLRRLDDPENAPFLESITKSECPKELEPEDKRSSVHVNLVRRDENYPETEVHNPPFQGVGRTLGSSSSAATESPREATVIAPTSLVLDESQPSTSIQIRLADGTRVVERFNYHHTVANLRSTIESLRPEGTRTYLLQTVGFPPKVLSDHNQTIKQAGLLNSVVIQKN